MQKVDYIIVGLGIAGLSFCEKLKKNNKSFIVFDTSKNSSTLSSGGVINPTVLKRFTKVWNADLHISEAIPFYTELSKKLSISVLDLIPILRIFNSAEEQNNWMVASDKKGMSSYLSSKLIKNKNPHINAPFGFGKVLGTGRIYSSVLLNAYKEDLQNNNLLISEKFEYDLLEEVDDVIKYKDISAGKILFAEGISAIKNPFFPQDPKHNGKKLLIGNKGEYIIINAPDLNLKFMLKASLIIIPLGNDLYKVGTTYERDNYTNNTTQKAKEELKTKLSKIINCSFDVVDQIAGIRPTTRDRRPLMGTLKESSNKVFFNGLGTRGFISAPSLAQNLYNHLECGEELSYETDIKRHYHW